MLQVPVVLGGVEQRLGDRQAGVVDDEIHTTEGQHCRRERGRDLTFIGDVDRHCDSDIGGSDLGRNLRRAGSVDIGDHDTGALGRQANGDRPTDAGARTGDEGDAGGQWPGLRQPLQLGLFETPIFDAKLLGLVDRGVGRDRLCTAHHVDRIDVELTGDTRCLLVVAEREHADARHQHDRRIGATHGRTVGLGVALVVAAVVLAVRGVQLLRAGR